MVERGETVEITDRGRPVALLTPTPAGSPLDRLRRAGLTEVATASLDELPAPVPLPDGAESPSTVLERLRRDER